MTISLQDDEVLQKLVLKQIDPKKVSIITEMLYWGFRSVQRRRKNFCVGREHVACEQQTNFRSREATTGNASAVRRLVNPGWRKDANIFVRVVNPSLSRSLFLDVTQRSIKRERCVTSKKRLRGRLGEPGVVKRGPRECVREWDKREMTAPRFDAK